MPLPLDLIRQLQAGTPDVAWNAISEHAMAMFSDDIDGSNPVRDIVQREKSIGDVDLFLATAGWDLWRAFGSSVTRTSDALAEWWAQQNEGCAVLVLSALSLRELPWLRIGLNQRGYTVHAQRVTAAELPGATTPFANALGLPSRSALFNDGAGPNHRLPGARTEFLSCAWEDAASQVTSAQRWFMWHAWPDSRLHELATHGKGIQDLVKDVAHQLSSDGFWNLIERLSQGRRLVITGDHGYAATGLFPDIADKKQATHMKERLKASRYAPDDGTLSPWVPPIDVTLDGPHGRHRFALGRRKWKVSSGHPTLSHGGLTVLEALVPFIEVYRSES